ncbi:glycoside hydrolase N-terminal domain-containing protein [Balneolaceae bacterium ANBcel3]|nr:glycoside hydrolase N-terminal domain-containing protein [Balneolaceae bacterium ANBcel3]
MKYSGFLYFFIFLLIASSCEEEKTDQKQELKLWYDQPAEIWVEALPIGNGRLGAMIYGDPVNETIMLNEETFWSGGPSRNDNPGALEALPRIRQLIFDGELEEADRLVNTYMVAEELHGSMYQVVGNLNLTFEGHEHYTNFYRDLNLETATSKVSYTVDGVSYEREIFASEPDQVIVMRLTASEPGMLSFTADMDGPLQQSAKVLDDQTFELTGLSSTHEGVEGQVKFNARSVFQNKGGSTSLGEDHIRVSDADEVLVFISIATNFVDYETLSADETERNMAYLSGAKNKTYQELLDRHMDAYQHYFHRVHLDLGTSPRSKLPTDQRIREFVDGGDPELVTTLFQFGRYLLISSSQPGGQPANLQGIWNDTTHPAWDSKYTLNINCEMNYWPAEKTNLPEMHEPLIQMVKELSKTGRETAERMYGADGWVVHHNTDIWRITGVIDGALWGMWPMGGAWLTQHLWEKYLYSGDKEYLESVYPVMRSASRFFQDHLIEEPVNRWMVVNPSNSPENTPKGHPTSLAAGPTMDNQLLFDLFTKTIRAAEILEQDDTFREELQVLLDRLPPMQIGRYGQIQEWLEDWDDPNDNHRHISHLYGLHPSNQISPFRTPELYDAARTTLIHRDDVSTGWSMGWKINFWARLFDGEQALKLISDQLTLVDSEGRGGSYPNMFGSHPPFQIDGNFGATSGITEMLLQTHDGAIHFLPALPDEWESGEVSGLRTYGGFEVGFRWENGEIVRLEVTSNLGGNCRIRIPNELQMKNSIALKPAVGVNPNPFFETAHIKKPIISSSAVLNPVKLPVTYLMDFETEAGQTYVLEKR